jgi:hypothetical protein
MSSRPAKKVHTPVAEVTMLRSLHKVSKEDWTEEKKSLWSQFVKTRRDMEIGCLKSEMEMPPEKAEKLVKAAWVKRNPDSGELVVENLPPKNSSEFVPVILVYRDGVFEIETHIRGYLEDHPLVRLTQSGLSDSDARDYVMDALEEVDAVEEECGWGYRGLEHLGALAPEADGEAARLSNWGFYAHELRRLLNSDLSQNKSEENPACLVHGHKSSHFWDLMKTAICFGEARGRRRILDLQNLEQTIQRMVVTPSGKNTSPAGQVVERMIESYTLANGTPPTALKLLRWLGSDSKKNENSPLQINHELWRNAKDGAPLPEITFSQFEELVKGAKKRSKR